MAEIRTIIIAASDASPEMRAIADYLCDGVDDDVEFHAAIKDLDSGGVIKLYGTFNFTDEND